jgi:energy-converting hydrogenase Eha subunit G
VKYWLRTNLMFEREVEFVCGKIGTGLSGNAKVNKALSVFYALQERGNAIQADEWREIAVESNFF